MTYHELIELYKTGKLDDTQKKQVESDIERHDAISEYLFDQEEFSSFQDVFSQDDSSQDDSSQDVFSQDGSSQDGFSQNPSRSNIPLPKNTPQRSDQESERFTNMIQSAIRKSFIKAGIITGGIVLAVVFFVVFALPQIADKLYYDPSEIVCKDNGHETNRLSLDLAVFTEIFFPENYRDLAYVEGNGYGKYDITFPQLTSYSNSVYNVAGNINKGKMTLYDANYWIYPSCHAFVPADSVYYTYSNINNAGNLEDSLSSLHELDETNLYTAYISLDTVMNYEEFSKWASNNNILVNWCAICEYDDSDLDHNPATEYIVESIMGFRYSSSYTRVSCGSKDYPLLTQYELHQASISTENIKQHVVSLFRFMEDEKTFYEMMDYVPENYFDSIADNIEEYGVNIYAFTVTADKETLLEIGRLNGISSIYTSPVK